MRPPNVAYNQFTMRALTLTVAAITLLSLSAPAQILDRLERRAKQRTNQRVDRKVDEKIDKGVDSGLDAVENIFKKKGDNGEESADETPDRENRLARAMMSGMGVSEGAEDVLGEYKFDHTIDMRFQTFNRRGKLDDEVEMTMLVNDSEPYTGMKTLVEGHDGANIFDTEKSRMITLVENNGEKTGIVMSFDPDGYEFEEDNHSPDIKFSRTGETKQISGYHCVAYKVEDQGETDGDDVTMWMTEETELNWMETFTAMSQSEMTTSTGMPADYPEGSMIMMETISAKNGEKSIMLVDKINMNSATVIPTAGYSFMTIGKGR